MDNNERSAIAFGSCNKQTKPQDFWREIENLQPSHFLWTGDAVYTKDRAVEKLSLAFQNLTSNEFYANFAKGVQIDGVWDDHDYGVNDAGRFIDNYEERAKEYTQFLTGSSDTKLRTDDNSGIYHTRDITVGGVTAKIIFLDTRTFRDNHYIKSVGEYPIKGSAVLGSLIRGVYSTLGLGRFYAGEMLGEAQWDWLRRTLVQSAEQKVDLTIIVSSVQVLTTNPFFECWAHFPVEKARLFNLLSEVNLNNLLFLSGDVHLGEVSETSYTREDGSTGKWTEVTSSGLTHSCSEGLMGYLCPAVTALFSQHRRDQKSIYLKRNFGLIEARPSQDSNNWEVEVSVRALPGAQPMLSHSIMVDKSTGNARSPIASVQNLDFPQVPLAVIVVALFVFACIARVMLYERRRKATLLKRQYKPKQK